MDSAGETLDRSTAWWRDVAGRHGVRYIDASLDHAAEMDDAAWQRLLESGQQDIWSAVDRLPIHVPSSGSVLDVGCGVGRSSFALARRFDRVLGVDVNEHFLQLARARNVAANVRFLRLTKPSLESLPGAPFDLVFTCEVFHHLRREVLSEYLRSIFALLAPGGQLVFQINTAPRGVIGKASMIARRLLHICGVATWRNWPTAPGFDRQVHRPRYLRRLLADTGYDLQHCDCSRPRNSWFVAGRTTDKSRIAS